MLRKDFQTTFSLARILTHSHTDLLLTYSVLLLDRRELQRRLHEQDTAKRRDEKDRQRSDPAQTQTHKDPVPQLCSAFCSYFTVLSGTGADMCRSCLIALSNMDTCTFRSYLIASSLANTYTSSAALFSAVNSLCRGKYTCDCTCSDLSSLYLSLYAYHKHVVDLALCADRCPDTEVFADLALASHCLKCVLTALEDHATSCLFVDVRSHLV